MEAIGIMGVILGSGVRLIMENQMEKNLENKS